ncbi:MAG: protein O-mannosyl-transferase [Verrucomicrobiota bacterium]|jgi:Flp pilus assembly protein TadD
MRNDDSSCSIGVALPAQAGALRKIDNYLQRRWLRCAFVAVIGFIIRMPALQGQMVWDDSYLIRDNPFIKSPLFIFEAFRHYLFLDSFSAHYRPVQNLSFIADYFFWNTNTYGFHLTNVLLHVASGILLYVLLDKLFVTLRKDRASLEKHSAWSLAAFFVALLWVVHPVHSAAIDYISGRADSLAFAFACAGWLLFLCGRASRVLSGQIAQYFLAALCGLLALCSREIACIWFVLFLVHLIFSQKEIGRRALLLTIAGSFCVIAIYAGLRQLPGVRIGHGPSSGWVAPMRAVLMFRSLGDYTRLMIFPSNLHMERTVIQPQNYLSNAQWRESAGAEYLSILGLAFLAALAFAASRTGAGRPLRVFGASWFLLGYLPISNLVELNATVAEHWLYLPSVGFLIFLAGCALDLPLRFQKATLIAACFAVCALSVRSAFRSSDWLTDETFYRRTLAAGGQSARVLANLAQIYSVRGEYAKAEAMFRNVLKMSPDYPIARNNLAEILVRTGKKKEAEELLADTTKATENTRKEYPRTWIAVLNLALYRHREKDDAGALAIAEKARHDYPGVWEVIRFESEILRETQRQDRAIELVENFARENWWHYGAALALGRLYAERGDGIKAEAALRDASWLDVHDVEALDLIAQMHLRANHLEDACATQRRAVARQPDQPRQYALLSNILEKMGRTDEARAATAKVALLQALAQTAVAAN